MRYSFLVNDAKGFCGCSTVYTVYDTFTEEEVTCLVIGYSSSHELFYVTEYGGDNYNRHIVSDIEFCAILDSFVKVFELMDLSDIFRSKDIQDRYEEHVPAISKDNLIVYSTEGRITKYNDEFMIVSDDCSYLEQLSYQGVFDTKQFFREYCTGDEDIDDLFEDVDLMLDSKGQLCDDSILYYHDGIFLINVNWPLVAELANKYNRKAVI